MGILRAKIPTVVCVCHFKEYLFLFFKMGNFVSCTPETRKRVCTIATAGLKAGIEEARKDTADNTATDSKPIEPVNSVVVTNEVR